MAALLFLYRHVLEKPLPWLDDLVRAQRPERLPVVLTIEEVRDVIAHLEPPAKLVVQLLYGSGLRLLETLTLRIKDVDFARGQLTIRDPKWKHDRTTMLPASVTAELHEQVAVKAKRGGVGSCIAGASTATTITPRLASGDTSSGPTTATTTGTTRSSPTLTATSCMSVRNP